MSKTNKPAIGVHIQGIKCDKCDYVDTEVRYEDYPKWLNKPCPTCGANLLTEVDYNTTKQMVALAEQFNQIFPAQEISEDKPRMVAEVELNGTGEVSINAKEDKDESD